MAIWRWFFLFPRWDMLIPWKVPVFLGGCPPVFFGSPNRRARWPWSTSTAAWSWTRKPEPCAFGGFFSRIFPHGNILLDFFWGVGWTHPKFRNFPGDLLFHVFFGSNNFSSLGKLYGPIWLAEIFFQMGWWFNHQLFAPFVAPRNVAIHRGIWSFRSPRPLFGLRPIDNWGEMARVVVDRHFQNVRESLGEVKKSGWSGKNAKIDLCVWWRYA